MVSNTRDYVTILFYFLLLFLGIFFFLVFKYLAYLKLILVFGVWWTSFFFFLNTIYQFHLLKNLCFPQAILNATFILNMFGTASQPSL